MAWPQLPMNTSLLSMMYGPSAGTQLPPWYKPRTVRNNPETLAPAPATPPQHQLAFKPNMPQIQPRNLFVANPNHRIAPPLQSQPSSSTSTGSKTIEKDSIRQDANDSGYGDTSDTDDSQLTAAHPSKRKAQSREQASSPVENAPEVKRAFCSTRKFHFSEGVMAEKDARDLRIAAQRNYMRVQRGRRASRAKRRQREIEGLPPIDDQQDGALSTSCPHCGKEYRQNNSLFKHLYEHHPEWDSVSEAVASSKHQRVMMMQTAELLLSLRAPTQRGLQPLVRF